MIVYDKFFATVKAKGMSLYKIRKNKLMGESTIQKLRENGEVETRTINRICAMLDCQPGDIMEYIPGQAAPSSRHKINSV